MPGPNVPFPPMEAQLVEKLPEGERWQCAGGGVPAQVSNDEPHVY